MAGFELRPQAWVRANGRLPPHRQVVTSWPAYQSDPPTRESRRRRERLRSHCRRFNRPSLSRSRFIIRRPRASRAARTVETGPTTPQVNLHDASYAAGARFDVRAGKRKISLNLSSGYEHIGRNDKNFVLRFTLDSASTWSFPTRRAVRRSKLSRREPAFARRRILRSCHSCRDAEFQLRRAALLRWLRPAGSRQSRHGVNSYGGKLTFNIRESRVRSRFGASQDRYQDTVLPLNGHTQTTRT